MRMQEVASSSLRRMGYDPDTSVLRVEFNSGALWEYGGVTAERYEELARSESVGSAFHRLIKSSHSGVRVTSAPTSVDLAVARGRGWCTVCGEEMPVRPAEFSRRGWPKHCDVPVTLRSPEERRVVLPRSEAETRAEAAVGSDLLLMHRMRVALRRLGNRTFPDPLSPLRDWVGVVRSFSLGALSSTNRTLLSHPSHTPNLALVWRTRPRPDLPESYSNPQTGEGVVSLVLLASGEEVVSGL